MDLDWVGDSDRVGNELLALDDDLAVVGAGAGTVATMATATALGRVEVDGDDVDCVELWCRRRDQDGWGRRRRREFDDWRRRGWQLEHGGRWRREGNDGRRRHFDVNWRGRARRRDDGGNGAVDGGVARKLGLEIEPFFGPSSSLALVSSHWGCVSKRVSQSMEGERTHSWKRWKARPGVSLKEFRMCLVGGQTSTSFVRRTRERIKSVEVAEQEVEFSQM